MSEHLWLSVEDLVALRDRLLRRSYWWVSAHALSDLAAAKALLRECAGYVRYWSDQPTGGDAYVERVVADLRALLARIRAVPGVEEASSKDGEADA